MRVSTMLRALAALILAFGVTIAARADESKISVGAIDAVLAVPQGSSGRRLRF